MFKSTRDAHASEQRVAIRNRYERRRERERGAQRVCVSACARNGACPAVEVGGRVSFHPVCFSGLSVHRRLFSTCPRLTSVYPSVRRPVAEQNMDLNVKSEKKTVADKVVLFEQKRAGARDVFTRTESGRKTPATRLFARATRILFK